MLASACQGTEWCCKHDKSYCKKTIEFRHSDPLV